MTTSTAPTWASATRSATASGSSSPSKAAKAARLTARRRSEERPLTTTTRTAAPSAAARRRQPRGHPRARRAREQPQGRERRAPEAPADRVHRRLGVGQELARVRHDRRRVAADDQRDLQLVRAGLHADAGTTRRGRAGGPDDRDHRRPGADGRQRPLHRRHRDRRQRDAPDRVQPARASRTSGRPRRSRSTSRPSAGSGRSRSATRRPRRRTYTVTGGMCPRCEGMGTRQRLRPHRPVRREQVAQRRRAHDPRLQHGRLVRPDLPGRRVLRPRQADQGLHEARAPRPALQGADQDQGRGHQPHLRGPRPEDPEDDAGQGRRRAPAPHPGIRGAGGDALGLPGLRRHPAERGRAFLEDPRGQHRRRVRDADQRPRRMGPRPGRAVGRAAAAATCSRRSTRS